MNELSENLFILITAMSLLFLIGATFLEDHLKALIAAILSTAGFFSLGQLIINGKVGVFYVGSNQLQFMAIQSSTVYYLYDMLALISFFFSLYLIYQIILEIQLTKHKSAFIDQE